MHAKELFDIAESYEKHGKLDMARRSYARIITLYPKEIAAYDRLCQLALNDGDHSQALAFVEKGLAVNDQASALWNNRGRVLADMGEASTAHESFQIALRIEPNNREALNNLGMLLTKLGKFEEAEQIFRTASILRDEHPEPLIDHARSLARLHRYNDALEELRLANPSAVVLTAQANCLYRLHRFVEAEEALSKALSFDVAGAEAHVARSLLKFSTGDLAEAWKEYEWRFELPHWQPRRSFARKQQWLGEPLRGATLLVHAEQGLGDSLQFVRFIQDIAKRDCEIVVDIQPELFKLCSSSIVFPNVRWSRREALPASDLQIPLLSVPTALEVTYDNLPPFRPYIFAREREVQEWRGKMNRMTGIAWGREVERRKQLRVGLVWAGSAQNPDDRNRSMTFEQILPVVEAHKEHAIFFSLQRDQRTEHPDVIDLGAELKDFAITSAIVENLDLLISVDTSVAHLAGAMGKRVWTLLSHTPDWRWIIGQKETKWYSSMSLLSQREPGKWDDPIVEVSALLDR